MIETSPCKGCTERFTACSDRCPKDARGEFGYKAWRERYHAQQKHLDANRYRMSIPRSPAREKTDRSFLKFGSGGRKYGGNQ